MEDNYGKNFIILLLRSPYWFLEKNYNLKIIAVVKFILSYKNGKGEYKESVAVVISKKKFFTSEWCHHSERKRSVFYRRLKIVQVRALGHLSHKLNMGDFF